MHTEPNPTPTEPGNIRELVYLAGLLHDEQLKGKSAIQTALASATAPLTAAQRELLNEILGLAHNYAVGQSTQRDAQSDTQRVVSVFSTLYEPAKNRRFLVFSTLASCAG